MKINDLENPGLPKDGKELMYINEMNTRQGLQGSKAISVNSL